MSFQRIFFFIPYSYSPIKFSRHMQARESTKERLVWKLIPRVSSDDMASEQRPNVTLHLLDFIPLCEPPPQVQLSG